MPSANRPSQENETYFLQASTLKELGLPKAHESVFIAESVCVVIPVLPHTNTQSLVSLLQGRAGFPFRLFVIEDDLKLGPTKVLNAAYRGNTDPVFIYLAQDVFPSRYWLARGLKTMAEKKLGLLALNDGKWAGQMAGFGMVRRDWCKHIYQGSLFFEGYRQHYGDAELSLIARQQKVYGYDPNVVMMEVDFEKDGKPVNAKDRELFAQRKLSGFDGRVTDTELLGLFA